MKRTKSIEELLPWLYLKRISTDDHQQALAALLGEQAKYHQSFEAGLDSYQYYHPIESTFTTLRLCSKRAKN